MGILVTIAQLFLSLTILVTLHEFGHYIAARMFGTRVDKFYLFFDFLFPFPDKMNYALFKKKIGDTEFGIGWFPMGGYVSIAGMQDETQDAPDPDRVPAPDEYGSKKKWQKLIIMLGGVIVNFILGFFIYAMVLWVWGEDLLPNKEVKQNGIYVDSLGEELGFKDGDHILKIGDKPFEYMDRGQFRKAFSLGKQNQVTVLRDGKEMTFTVNEEARKKLLKYKYRRMEVVGARFPFVLDSVIVGNGGDKAGLKKGDKIVSLNDTTVNYFSDYNKRIKNYKDKEVKIGYLRSGVDSVLYTNAKVNENSKLGINAADDKQFFDYEHIDYSLGAAFPAGFSKGSEFIKDQFSAFGMMFSGEMKASESLGGFGSIGGLFGQTWNWKRFWYMTGILSLILAIMNLLPIPLLDGGYVVFLLYEMITGREIPDRIMNVLLNIGLYLVLFLMLYSNGLDILRALGIM